MKKNKGLLSYASLFVLGCNFLPALTEAHTNNIDRYLPGKLVNTAPRVIPIKGKVTDSKGEPISGVSVLIKGTSIGTTTTPNGMYSLVVPDNNARGTLVISSTGYETKEIEVGSSTTIDIILQAEIKKLDEVIMVGYGSQKRRDVIGSISKVKGSDITKVPTVSFSDALQGQASGLFVSSPSGHPGAGPEIKIRGKGSINLSSSPLFIVDGVPVQTGSVDLTLNGVRPVSPLAMLNPNDIESIEILKDASATAIYGNRGSNGVIIVTTKAAKSNKTGLSITYNGGISQLPYKQNDIYMDNKEYWQTIDKA